MITVEEIRSLKLKDLGERLGIHTATCEGRVTIEVIKTSKVDMVAREREKNERTVLEEIGERRIFDWETPITRDKIIRAVVCRHNAFFFKDLAQKQAIKALGNRVTMALVSKLAEYKARDISLALEGK